MEDSPRPRRVRVFWPLIFITGGILLLLQNFGLLPPGMWQAIFQLWPVALILLGLEMLIGRRSLGGSLLILLIGVAVVGGALWWAATRAQTLAPTETRPIAQDFKAAELADVTLNFKAGDLTVTALSGSDHLMEGTVTVAPGETRRQSYEVRDQVGWLVLEQEPGALLTPFLSGSNSLWEVRLTTKAPLTLTANTGAGKTTLDLSELQVTHLTVNAGVGETSVNFPSTGQLQVLLNAGVGQVILTLPADLPTRITFKTGITNVEIPSRFASQDNVYTTPNFSTTGDYVDLEINAGIGQVVIK